MSHEAPVGVPRDVSFTVSPAEPLARRWHPFTISSARGDLHSGARVALDDGERVLPVDAPAHLEGRRRARWRKYRRASADPETVDEDDLLDPHETTHHDYVSVHIRVIDRGDGSRTWTQQLKDYLEMMAPRRESWRRPAPFRSTRAVDQSLDERRRVFAWRFVPTHATRDTRHTTRYPFHFTRRDDRGELLLGRHHFVYTGYLIAKWVK